MEYQNSNMKNNINENTENFILKQIESNDLRVKRKKFDFY